MFTYSNGYWEVHRRFQGDFLVLGDISMEKLLMGEENFDEGAAEFSSFI